MTVIDPESETMAVYEALRDICWQCEGRTESHQMTLSVPIN